MTNTDKSSTHQHTVRGTPTTSTGVHSHALTTADAALAAITARITKLEAQMADVILTITQLTGPTVPPGPGPVPPPVQPPVPPPIEPTPGTGTVRYIAPTGSDSADGLIGTPWRTINKFFKVAKAGDTLYCRGGTYLDAPIALAGFGSLPTLAGTASAPITIRNYPGEFPIFSGGSGGFMGIAGSCAYVVIDGLRFQNRYLGSHSSLIYFGAQETDGVTYKTHHITVRNCYFAEYSPVDSVGYGHILYPSGGARYITVEDCTFVGASGFTGTIHGAVHAYGGETGSPNHFPPPKDILVQRCIFLDWETSAVVYVDASLQRVTTGSVLHNTFIDCATDINAGAHGTLLVRDNATSNANTSSFISDPRDAAYTTADHNAFSCTFTGDYHLAVGSNGHDAASDGTDCGALDN